MGNTCAVCNNAARGAQKAAVRAAFPFSKAISLPHGLTASIRRLQAACRRWGVPSSQYLFIARVSAQRAYLLEGGKIGSRQGDFQLKRQFVASTSRYGIGQVSGSNRTPLGLHRIAQKIGGGQPVGTVFQGRKPTRLLSHDAASPAIAHRILWLEGLEPRLNQGGEVDTFRRYIYIHGTHDELTLGQPASHGCVHLGASDLLWLFDLVPSGTLVWIEN